MWVDDYSSGLTENDIKLIFTREINKGDNILKIVNAISEYVAKGIKNDNLEAELVFEKKRLGIALDIIRENNLKEEMQSRCEKEFDNKTK